MQKTIHYRTAEWFGTQENLVSLITQTLADRPNVSDTEFQTVGETCEVRHRVVDLEEVRLHVSLHVPGALKAISPRVINVPEADISVATAPQNTEFTEREIAIVIRQNAVGYVVAGRAGTSTVRNILAGLIQLGHGEGIGNRLNLSARADEAAIRDLLEQGVDRFDLGLNLPNANAIAVVQDQPLRLGRSIGRAVAQTISTRFEADHLNAHIDELANMNVKITINARRSAPEAEIETLTALATDAVEHDDEFKIRTRNRAEFSREQLILTARYRQPGELAVLNYIMAWNEISSFLNNVR